MAKIKVFYNAECPASCNIVRMINHHDWVGQVNCSSKIPRIGRVPLRELAVFEFKTRRWYTGIYAKRKIYLHLPLFYLLGLLLYLPLHRPRTTLGINGVERHEAAVR